jgi:hypothetical protein
MNVLVDTNGNKDLLAARVQSFFSSVRGWYNR